MKTSEESYSQQDSDHLNPVYKADQMKNLTSSVKNVIDTFSHLVNQEPVPDIELDVFDGNLLGFYYFMTFLGEVVEKEDCQTKRKIDQTAQTHKWERKGDD